MAGIDVHKKMLAVAVSDIAGEESEFVVAKFATTMSGLRDLAAWLAETGTSEVVMESTAQYWQPVWLALEGKFRLHLAQAHSNAGRMGARPTTRMPNAWSGVFRLRN